MAIIVKRNTGLNDPLEFYNSTLVNQGQLFVGLGNPGKRYRNHRHNAGFMCLDGFVEQYPEMKWQDKPDWNCLFSQISFGQTRLLLIKPQTYMNLSGQAVAKVQHYYKIEPQLITVIYDDVRQKLGQIKIETSDETYGHNGLKSVKAAIGSGFSKLGVGIGPRKPSDLDLNKFVLADFSKDEQPKLAPVIREVVSLIGQANGQPLADEIRQV